MAIRINADDTIVDVAPANGREFTLPELQAVVGGYIEAVYLRDGRILFCNEDGKRDRLPTNVGATVIARNIGFLPDDDHIVGDVIIGTRREMGADDADDE